MIALYHFKPLEKAGFKYFKGTREIFGLRAAFCQVSPLFNLVMNWREFLHG
jgi:hypothetical protein